MLILIEFIVFWLLIRTFAPLWCYILWYMVMTGETVRISIKIYRFFHEE